MKHLATLRNELESKNNFEWFNSMCELLKKKEFPNVRQFIDIIGREDQEIKRENRGSKFLIPYDKRFNWACINPDLEDIGDSIPIEGLAFGGEHFEIKMPDLLHKFPEYKITGNTYDGGSQIFLFPIPVEYEFSAISLSTEKEPEEIENINELIFNSVSFKFGEKLVQGRDGFSLIR